MFEITIKKIEMVKTTKQGAWVCLKKHLLTERELQVSVYSTKPEYEKKLLVGEPIWVPENGYAPDVEAEEELESKVFSQRVEELDLAAVVKAVNKIA